MSEDNHPPDDTQQQSEEPAKTGHYPAPVAPATAAHNERVEREMNSGLLAASSTIRDLAKAHDGRYYPTKFDVHPCLIDGFEEALKAGDSIYIAHAFNKYFVVSKEQAEAGMVLGNIKFPEPANLIETIPSIEEIMESEP